SGAGAHRTARIGPLIRPGTSGQVGGLVDLEPGHVGGVAPVLSAACGTAVDDEFATAEVLTVFSWIFTFGFTLALVGHGHTQTGPLRAEKEGHHPTGLAGT